MALTTIRNSLCIYKITW